MKVDDVVFSAYTAILLATITLIGTPMLFGDGPSLRDIGEPCRDHGGVRQYVPETHQVWNADHALVVCVDGKVGRP